MKIVRVFVTEDWGFSLETAVYVLQYNHAAMDSVGAKVWALFWVFFKLVFFFLGKLAPINISRTSYY